MRHTLQLRLRSWTLCCALGACVLVPPRVMAQGTGALTAADLPAELSPATRRAIERLADSLRDARLPSDPVYAKAAEGVLKGATEARILGAVRAMAHELGDARDALGAEVDQVEIVAGASALHAGVPVATLRRLREASNQQKAGGHSLTTPLIVLADLVTRRVPAPIASAAVDSLVARGAPSADFDALRAAVERDILAGRAPDAAALTRTRSLLASMGSRARSSP